MKSPKSLNDLMSRDKASANLVNYQQKTSNFRAIQKLLVSILGDNIAQNIIVSNFKNSILYLETPSATIATAFKMHQSNILSHVRRKINPATVTVEMKVSPRSTILNPLKKSNNSEIVAPPTRQKSTLIPDEVANSIQSIAQSSDDKLKQSLERLMLHRKNK